MYFLLVYFQVAWASFLYCSYQRITCGNWSQKLSRRSSCDHCQHQLGVMDLFPIFSFVLLKGRCRYCKADIDPHVFFAEATALSLAIPIVCKLTISSVFDGLFLITLMTILLLMNFCDWHQLWIPDVLQAGYLILGLIYNAQTQVIPWLLLPFLILALIFLIPALHLFIGGADLKFMFISFLYIPLESYPAFMILAAILGLVYWYFGDYDLKEPLPFIPCLTLALAYCL